MSITTQVSFPKEREIQLSRIFAKCPDLAELGTSGAIYKILFDAMDRIVPLEKTGAPEKGALEKTGDSK